MCNVAGASRGSDLRSNRLEQTGYVWFYNPAKSQRGSRYSELRCGNEKGRIANQTKRGARASTAGRGAGLQTRASHRNECELGADKKRVSADEKQNGDELASDLD